MCLFQGSLSHKTMQFLEYCGAIHQIHIEYMLVPVGTHPSFVTFHLVTK